MGANSALRETSLNRRNTRPRFRRRYDPKLA
jgi:hypothetical protein